MPDLDAVAIIKARSMLVILVATCEQTLLALDAVDNLLDREMTNDLRRMIARSKDELEALNLKLEPAAP
jgi:hypothetical protein